jgi:hypothetical protein
MCYGPHPPQKIGACGQILYLLHGPTNFNPKAFAWSLEPEAWSLEPRAWSLEHGACSLEPVNAVHAAATSGRGQSTHVASVGWSAVQCSAVQCSVVND